MKNRFISFFLLFAAVLSGCSGDEERMPIGEAVGSYSYEEITYTTNGRKISMPVNAVISKYGGFGENSYDCDVVMELDWLVAPTGPCAEELVIKPAKVRMHAVSSGRGAIMEGCEEVTGGIMIAVRAEVTVMPDGKRQLDVNAEYELTASPLVGRTFEIDFDNESIYPVIVREDKNYLAHYDDQTFSPTEIAKHVFEQMNLHYVENSGWSGARFTFNSDCTMDLYFRMADTGQYVKSEYTHTYLATPNGLFLFDYAGYLGEQSRFYDIPPTVTGLDYPMRQQGIGHIGGIMYVMYELRPDGTLEMEWVPNFGYHFPKLTWYRTDVIGEKISRIQFLVNTFINIVPDFLEIRPVSLAREV